MSSKKKQPNQMRTNKQRKDIPVESDGKTDDSLDSIEADELNRKLASVKEVLTLISKKNKKNLSEVRRLLEIKGNTFNSRSIF